MGRGVKNAAVCPNSVWTGDSASNCTLKSSPSQVEPSPSCLSAVKSMRTCPACQGLPTIAPCNGFCLNVMKGCLAHHYHIDDLWARFIGDILPRIIIHEGQFPHLTPTLWWANQLWNWTNPNCVYLSDSLTSLAERLVGPFNVEMTVEPISIKISDAIMNFQESGFQVAADFNQLSIIHLFCIAFDM